MNHKATVKHEKFYPGLNLLPSGEFQSRSFRLFKKKTRKIRVFLLTIG
jgi:hypothetical protein